MRRVPLAESTWETMVAGTQVTAREAVRSSQVLDGC